MLLSHVSSHIINAGDVGSRQNKIVVAGFREFVPNDDRQLAGNDVIIGVVNGPDKRVGPVW